MVMKENNSDTFYDSKSYEKEADLLLGVKEVYQSDDFPKGTDSIRFEVNGRDDNNHNIMIQIFKDDESGMVESPTNEIPGGISQLEGLVRNTDSLSSETIDRGISQSSSAHEVSSVDKLVDCVENKSRDSGAPIIVSDVLDSNPKTYTEQNISEHQPRKLIVCVEEFNNRSVKNVCVDEMIPAKDKILSGSSRDGQPVVSQLEIPHENYHFHDVGEVENNSTESNGLATRYVENTKGVGQDECRYKEVSIDDPTKSMIKSALDSSFNKDGTESCDMETSTLTDKTLCGATGKIDTDFLEDEAFVERKLPIQKNSTKSSLASLFESFDGKEDKSFEPRDQTTGKLVSVTPAAFLTEAETGKDDHQHNMLENSKLEKRSASCDIPPASGITSIADGKIEIVREQSVESRDVDVHTDGDASVTYTKTVESTNRRVNSAVAVEEPSLGYNSSDTKQVRYTGSKNTRVGNTLVFIEHSSDLSASGKVPFASSKNQSSVNDFHPGVPHAIRHDRRNSDDSSIVSSLLHHGEGDSSFSAAGLITYSGPIAFSGSLSIRSDGSATSGKSFAFPILQSEWNSSPIRMAKGNRRRFWKQKSWKSGILCCRF